MCPDFTRRRCQRCGGDREKVGSISWRGLCEQCGLTRVADNLDGLASKRGPYAQWWAANLAASVGLGPLDEMPPKP
jgi:predicted amidophosphoribosyltransferase